MKNRRVQKSALELVKYDYSLPEAINFVNNNINELLFISNCVHNNDSSVESIEVLYFYITDNSSSSILEELLNKEEYYKVLFSVDILKISEDN